MIHRTLILLSLLFACAAQAQTPQALNYQAVARNAAGAVLANQTIIVKLSVNNNTATGTTVYSETHSGVTTNAFGLFTLEVGNGTPSTGLFSNIDWSNGAKFLKVETDFGTGYVDMGTSQLLSVPYALHANSVQNDNDAQTLSVSGNNVTISNGNTVALPAGVQTLNDLTDVNTAGAAANQVLQWNGSNWVPATVTGGVGDNWGTQSVVADAPLTGNGTAANHLRLANGTANGQVLKWNGTAWTAAADANTDAQTLSLSGNTLSISGGNNVTLTTGTTYSAGTGISISGSNVISATDNSTTNEIQTISKTGSTVSLSNGGGSVTDADNQALSLSGSSLSITGGNSVTLPTGTTYTAGSGISISANSISAADNSSTNELQTLSISGSQLTISGSGGNTVTVPSFTLPYTNTVGSASTLFDITNSGSGASGRFNISDASNSAHALRGETNGTGYGVYGYNNNSSGKHVGVFGRYNSSAYGAGVVGLGWQGIDTLPNQADIGVYGSANTWGVYGRSNNGIGLYGASAEDVGIYGESWKSTNALSYVSELGTPAGNFYSVNGQGIYAWTLGYDSHGATTSSKAVMGLAGSIGSEYNVGGYFVGYDGLTSNGVEAIGNGYGGFSSNVNGIVASTAGTGWLATRAGLFIGNVEVQGTLSKSGGTFKIDHPLDPENKYLYHSFVESPDMMNIYNGNVVTDESGNAVVELPAYFDALNKDFRYQLTVIGQFAQAIVSEKINGNRFVIKTDKPNVEVSWQVTGVRNDAWANANRVVPEMEKQGPEKGRYLHPELFGQPRSRSVGALNTAGGLDPAVPHKTKKETNKTPAKN